MLRPLPCRWFELITTRDELAPVLETLARAGTVELQAHEQTLEQTRAPRLIAGAEPLLERFHALDKAYRMHWPAHAAPGGTPSHPHLPVVADTTPMHRMADPLASFESRLVQLEAWRERADPLITAVERLEGERRNLSDLARLLAADADLLPDPGLVSGAGAGASGLGIEVRLQILPARAALPELPAELLSLVIPAGPGGADESFVLLVGRREALAASDQGFTARRARRIDWPADLRGDVAQAAREVQERRDTLEQRRAEHERALQDL
ncbi:MAG: hypothetical protein OEY03_17830, partial [Rhizobacter sp.]|nr:hypothetical protein [Rhizobacter sp.]